MERVRILPIRKGKARPSWQHCRRYDEALNRCTKPKAIRNKARWKIPARLEGEWVRPVIKIKLGKRGKRGLAYVGSWRRVKPALPELMVPAGWSIEGGTRRVKFPASLEWELRIEKMKEINRVYGYYNEKMQDGVLLAGVNIEEGIATELNLCPGRYFSYRKQTSTEAVNALLLMVGGWNIVVNTGVYPPTPQLKLLIGNGERETWRGDFTPKEGAVSWDGVFYTVGGKADCSALN